VFAKLLGRFRNERRERLKDELAVDRFLLEHEQGEREKARPDGLPPARSNTDWTYVNWKP